MKSIATLLSLWFWVNPGISAARTGESNRGRQIPVFEGYFYAVGTPGEMKAWEDCRPVCQVQSVGFLRCGARRFALWGWSEGLRPHTDHTHGSSVVYLSPLNIFSSDIAEKTPAVVSLPAHCHYACRLTVFFCSSSCCCFLFLVHQEKKHPDRLVGWKRCRILLICYTLTLKAHVIIL